MLISLVKTQQILSSYGLSTSLVFGIVGNILLICVLVRRKHPINSCSLYLLSITIVNLIIIQFMLVLVIYSANNPNPEHNSLVWCKIHSYVFDALIMLYRWYRIASFVDCAAMSSRHVRVRSFSQARVACRTVLTITCVCLLIPLHLAVYFRIEFDRCVPQSGIYAKIFSIYSIFISGWIPPLVMAVCGAIAYRNLKRSRERVHSRHLHYIHTDSFAIKANNESIHKRDQQLMLLSVCEIILYVSTNILYSVNVTYSTLTYDHVKSAQRIQIESFISHFSLAFLIIVNNGASFYLYSIISSRFRKDFESLFSHCFDYCMQVKPPQNSQSTKFNTKVTMN
ncbi:unnamed protein product [Rotaria socialis]|uniref:G-protein coupled receptors family 1 profile domain-containing protein n=1 Tax=Rotaria socialis TaxID=392032 RepID=A0A820WNP3_9BILA|nr:unnamed protein product [Rotaria socialis]CAF3685257.1 unnamed protein product [Rotaria socialis]CAF4202964.1 unnamed protein product [Rotaria socialis]CAF4518889.1 unnamed protein product [Rotaria socialis]